jgi:amidophosphoribosyltransferase
MGAFFGVVSKKTCMEDVFFGTDYHSHLGTKSGGLAIYDSVKGLQRKIHNLGNAPFRTRFEHVFEEMEGTSAIGCISDSEPQPLMIRSHLGNYAICVVGNVINKEKLAEDYVYNNGGHFGISSGSVINTTELIASLINQKKDFVKGIKFAQSEIKGTASIIILTEKGTIITARDKMGRLPVLIGEREDGEYCVSFESFAFYKLGYDLKKELGPGEIVELSAYGLKELSKPNKEMRICSFLWTYYGFSSSCYEGVNVEVMRTKNGEILAETDIENGTIKGIDSVCGVPDSGTPHAIGYANKSGIPFRRPYIKYTTTWSRSFMPNSQVDRSKIAKMKQIPVHELIKGKNLLFVDDSIVRGTQLKETVEFLQQNGAKSVHMRSACPPIMFGCKYLNFTRVTSDLELISRRTILELEGEEGLNYLDEYSDAKTERGKKMREAICKKFGFDTLEFQTLEGMIKAIGVDPKKLCTYCWNGKE